MVKNNNFVLKIFCLGYPLLNYDWSSLLGDKYRNALPFEFTFTDKMEEASVIIWDGIISQKMGKVIEEIESHFEKNKILILTGEPFKLYETQPSIALFKPNDILTFELPGWNILPEEILALLDKCYKKLMYV
jgi:hypothetical protein